MLDMVSVPARGQVQGWSRPEIKNFAGSWSDVSKITLINSDRTIGRMAGLVEQT